MQKKSDNYFMSQALKQVEKAAHQGEVPIGAVLVHNDKIIATSYNQPITRSDPTAHAEILVLRDAAKKLNNYRLLGTTLYVTLEPCAMCVAAMIHARIKRLVFGAYDPKTGAVCSALKLIEAPHFNHHIEWQGGVMAEECGELLKSFFQNKR